MVKWIFREGTEEKLRSSKSTSTMSTENKSGVPREALFQDRTPSYVQHIAARWKTSVLLPQASLAGRAQTSGGSNKENVGGGNLCSFCSTSHMCFPAMAPGHYSCVRISVPVCWAMAPKFLKGSLGHHNNQQQPEKPRVWFMGRIPRQSSVCSSHSWCVHIHTQLCTGGASCRKKKIKFDISHFISD